jgi:curved DNA-binding protein CbpA
MNLYDILEIKNNASESEIKKAYIKLAKKYHPDKNNNIDAKEKFQQIQMAYEILSNNQTRYEYNNLNDDKKLDFIDVIIKIVSNDITFEDIDKYCSLVDSDFIKLNFITLLKKMNIYDIFKLFNFGIINKSYYNVELSEIESESELLPEYYNILPIYLKRINNNDINIDISITINELNNNYKKKVKIKRNVNNNLENSTFIFNISHQYIIFINGGDNNENLIIKLILPNNYYWYDDCIIYEIPISLYQMIYGLNISLLDFDFKQDNWIPYRDGFIINTNYTINNYKLIIKLSLNYIDNIENKTILENNFSNIY